MTQNRHYTPCQASRIGRSAITIFVKAESKPRILAALADAGFGTSFQKGFIELINDLLKKQERQTIE